MLGRYIFGEDRRSSATGQASLTISQCRKDRGLLSFKTAHQTLENVEHLSQFCTVKARPIHSTKDNGKYESPLGTQIFLVSKDHCPFVLGLGV